jgi:hypothetical protein
MLRVMGTDDFTVTKYKETEIKIESNTDDGHIYIPLEKFDEFITLLIKVKQEMFPAPKQAIAFSNARESI